MKDNTKFVGLDVSKDKIAVAIAEEGREKPRYYGMISNNPESIRRLVKKLGDTANLQVCYEAGVTGYGLYRLFLRLGIECAVIAPGLIPQRPGDRVKTDKRDAVRLAQLFRAGELTSIYVPTEEDEALRDLVRAREDMKEDELRAKHRITKLLIRYGINPPEEVGKNWSYKYREWIHKLTFKHSALSVAFQEYLQTLNEIEERLKRLDKELENQGTEGVHAPMIQAFQCLRGVALITATSLVAEIGSFRRFKSPKQLMAYAGLVPSESSSGDIRRQGKITKTGNHHVRRLLIESSWSYRYQPAVKGKLKKRQEGQPGCVQTISWKAQQRLHKKYFRLLARGKSSSSAVTAVARELSGFVWAIAQEIERQPSHIEKAS